MSVFVEVTEAAFYKAINPENVHPTPFENHCEWKNLSTHEVVGRVAPGYKGNHGAARRYWLTESFAMREQAAQGGQHE